MTAYIWSNKKILHRVVLSRFPYKVYYLFVRNFETTIVMFAIIVQERKMGKRPKRFSVRLAQNYTRLLRTYIPWYNAEGKWRSFVPPRASMSQQTWGFFENSRNLTLVFRVTFSEQIQPSRGIKRCNFKFHHGKYKHLTRNFFCVDALALPTYPHLPLYT